jgi:hypothetical protein
MNTRSNWILFVIAAGLAVYVFLLSPKTGVTVRGGAGVGKFEPVDPMRVTSVELIRSNSVMRVERTNRTWRMTMPVEYPAQAVSVDRLVEQLGRMVPATFITAAQVAAQPEALKAFGLEPPMATLELGTGEGPAIFRIGGLTPLRTHFYFQRVGSEGVYTADLGVLEGLPAHPSEWRDRALLGMELRGYDRVTLASRGRTAFEAVREGTRWRLRQPLSARADGERIEALVAYLQGLRVKEFVTDAAVIDRAVYGLQPPEFEVAIGLGTNDLARLQVGGVATNAVGERFVRRLSHTNVVRVLAEELTMLERPLEDFRDPRLFGPLEGVTGMEVRGSNSFRLALVGTNWMVTEPRTFPAERSAVELLLSQLSDMAIAQFVNDVVPDLTRYGLDRPGREFVVMRGTNVAAHLQVGKVADNLGTLLFARRLDEPGVYAVPRTVLFNLDSEAQVRSWRMDPTNVVQVTVTHQGRKRVFGREAGTWKVTEGTPLAEFIPDAIDEMLFQIGNWDSMRYTVTDEAWLTRMGKFGEVAHEVEIRLGAPAVMRVMRLRFGGMLGANRYVMARFDEDPRSLRLEMPNGLYEGLVRYLGLP